MGACICCMCGDKGRPADSPFPDRVPGGWGDFFASGVDLLPAWTPEVARKRGADCVRVKAGDVDELLEKDPQRQRRAGHCSRQQGGFSNLGCFSCAWDVVSISDMS